MRFGILYVIGCGGSFASQKRYRMLGKNPTRTTEQIESIPESMTVVTAGAHRSAFAYNGLSQRVKIVEKDNGTVTGTKQFVWCLGEPQPCEERDVSNTVTKRYYPQGMQVGSTNYYYTRDHLGSIREMTDSSGIVQTRYDYDPYGRRTKVNGSVDTDFGFTGHYYHQPSGLNLALYRAYDADLGRRISRDPIEEFGGLNLYGYVGNNAVNIVDPLGLEFLTDGRTALDDFIEQFINMRQAKWKNSDKYFHCMANCNAARRGGIDASDAELLSNIRETFDRFVKGDSKQDCAADQEANRHGREAGKKGEDCRQACNGYRPRGLPSNY
jgi:RHS repeat-associated protein